MARSTTSPAPANTPASYEDALRELERLVAGMEGGQKLVQVGHRAEFGHDVLVIADVVAVIVIGRFVYR